MLYIAKFLRFPSQAEGSLALLEVDACQASTVI